MKVLNVNKTKNEIKAGKTYSLVIYTNESNIRNKDLVREVNSWWEYPDKANIACIEKLLNISEKESKKGFGLDFSEIKQGEHLLNTVFDQINEKDLVSIETAVFLLDSIYHTRLQSPLRVANKIHKLFEQENFLNKIKEAKEQQEIIDCVNTITNIDKENDTNNNYIYSFATKFCNRINPRAFPIFDSYVAGLLYRYNRKKNEFTKTFTQASLGNYNNFFETYKHFIDAYQLSEFDFKKIDIFMWTYGKILSSKNSNYETNIQLSVKYFMTDEENKRIN